MLRLWEGIVRRALSEPSIGSITTRASPPSPKRDLAALLGDGDEGGALRRPASPARRRRRPRSGGRSPGCGRRPRRRPRRRCAPRCSRSRRRSPAARPRCGGRFPASLRRKRPSAGCYGALALGDARGAADDRRWRPTSASARSPTATGPLLVLGAAGTGKTELLARRLARLAADRDRARAGAGDRLHPGHRAAAARTRPRRCCEGPSRSSGSAAGTRSASGCCASTPRPPASTPSSTCSARPSGWRCCSTASTSCRCAGTRSAATRPACWPGCWPGSTR